MQNNIKNIVFDLGNVIIDIDPERTFASLRHLLGDNMTEKLATAYPAGDIFIDFEVGKIDENTFLDTLRGIADTPLSIREVKEAWNMMLLEIAPQRFDMLARLRQKYRVFLLSNTNSTHIDWVDGYLRTVFGFTIADFETRYFEKPYYSHIINLRKPNVNIYDFVAADADIVPAETLFIDDNAANIEGAKQAGWQTMLHPIGLEIADVLKDY